MDIENNAASPASSASRCYEEFGRMAFEFVKECFSEGCLECDAEMLADLAVVAGLMVYEPYDPKRHNMEFSDHEYEQGDMIYYWDKPSALRKGSPSCGRKGLHFKRRTNRNFGASAGYASVFSVGLIKLSKANGFEY